MTPSGDTTPSQSGLGSNDNEGVLHIPKMSKAGATPLDGLMSWTLHFSMDFIISSGTYKDESKVLQYFRHVRHNKPSL